MSSVDGAQIGTRASAIEGVYIDHGREIVRILAHPGPSEAREKNLT